MKISWFIFCYVKCWNTNTLRPPRSRTATAESSHLASVRPDSLTSRASFNAKCCSSRYSLCLLWGNQSFTVAVPSSCFFCFCVLLLWQTPKKTRKKQQQQHWPGNNYLTMWSMFVCFWKCVHICFCAFACAIYECGSWQFTSLGSVLIRRSQCYLSAISLSLRNPQITASSHEWDPSCFLHHNLKYWLKNSTVMRYSHCKQIKEGAQRVWRTFRCWWERTVIWLHIDWGYW